MWIRRVGGEVRALAYAPAGGTLYTAEGGRVCAWDIAARTPTRLFTLRGHASDLFVAGRMLVARTGWSHCHVWDLVESKSLADLASDRWGGLAPVPTGSAVRFVSASVVRSHDLLTRKTVTLVRKIAGFGHLKLFAFSPDEQTVVLSDGRRYARVTVSTGESVAIDWSQHTLVSGFQFTPDGSLIWLCWNRIYLSDISGRFIWAKPVECSRPDLVFALHPNAPVFAALNPNAQLTLFSLRTGEALRTFEFELGRWVRRVAFSPDGLTCAVGGSNKQFAVFDVDV